MSLTEIPVQKVEGTEVDTSVEIVVDGVVDKLRGFIEDILCDHESPVGPNCEQFIDNNSQQQTPQATAAKEPEVPKPNN